MFFTFESRQFVYFARWRVAKPMEAKKSLLLWSTRTQNTPGAGPGTYFVCAPGILAGVS